MSKELCISSTPHETRLAIVEDDQLTEIYYERENEYTLAGSIYKGRVTRVLPGMQSAFVDVGLERDAFLYVTDFLEEQGETAEFEKPRAEGQAGRRDGRQPRVARESSVPGEEAAPRESSPRQSGEGRGESRKEGHGENRSEGRSESRNEGRNESRSEHRARPDPVPTEESAASDSAAQSATARPNPAAGVAPDGASPDEFDQGTRKWRGRRGRRRGFRGGQREGSGTSTSVAQPAASQDENFADEPQAPSEAVAGLPISAAAERPAKQRPSFSSTADHGRQAHREAAASVPAGKPTFLPGESLSKYGHQSATGVESQADATAKTLSKPPAITTSRPSTIVEVMPGWDGVSAALPGESLSRYKNRPAAQATSAPIADLSGTAPEPVPDTASMQPQHFDAAEASSHHFESPLSEGSFAEPTQVEPVQVEPAQVEPAQVEPAQVPSSLVEHESEAQPLSETGHAGSLEILHAVNTPHGITFEDVSSSVGPQPVPLVLEEAEGGPVSSIAATDGVEPGDDFEPEAASASYRVAPSPSEFRLPSLAEEQQESTLEGHPEAFTQAASLHPEFPAVEEFTHAAESLAAPWSAALSEDEATPSIEPGRTDAHMPDRDASGFDPEPQAAVAPENFATESSQAPEIISTPTDTESAEHRFFNLEDGFTEEVRTPQAEAAVETEPDAQPMDRLHAFAPGAGELEEEVIDEEEFDFSPIHSHADEHDLEEIEEEETVDNSMVGSQLGDLVRDEHIQRRVMGEPETDDNDESEEFESTFDSSFESPEEDSVSEADEAHALAESAAGGFTEEDFTRGNGTAHEAETHGAPAPQRDDKARDGRGGQRGGRRGAGQRGRSGGGHRHSAQTSDLPIISDLLKQGQEVLVQIAKEPIAKKGARITSHIALPGRFLVFMPTVSHVGVSRKISSDEERLRLKRILSSEKGTAPGGFIVRTAADGASEEELRADLRFLISLWTEIKQRSDTGKSPALIYHDLNLVERILRDQVSDSFSTIWVDSETEYERIVRFLNRFEPSLVRRVKLYTKDTPLFEQFGIQEEISKALKSKVWLKSGGSIVINQTEALVAIDINTGKYVGKTARLEDTIVKTNLDAIPEIVRQMRLRDLGGIIIIDFIDMDERKNRHRVMQALEEALKADRAPSKVLQFNDFGLVAITRKRVKQSLERTLSTQCEICAGTGMVKSPITVCNEIYTELRKMQKHFERGDVLLRVHPEIVKTLKANNGKWLGELEEMIAKTIIVKSDPALHPEQFDIH